MNLAVLHTAIPAFKLLKELYKTMVHDARACALVRSKSVMRVAHHTLLDPGPIQADPT